MNSRVRFALWALLLGTPFLVGCKSISGIDIKGHDTTSFAPGFRLTKEFDDGSGDLRWVGAIDFDTTFMAGESDTHLGAGETLSFRSAVPITGPGAVDTEFDFFQVQVTARGGFLLHDVFSLQGLVGLGGQHTSFEAKTSTARGTQRLYSIGPHVGGRIGLSLAEWLQLYGQVRSGGGAGESGYTTRLVDVEAGMRVTPIDHVAFIGGWRWIRYDADGHSGDSDIEIHLSGPMVTLQILF